MSDFARLLEAEIPRVRRYARALTRDRATTDDLVQDCLLRAVAKQHLYQPGTNLRAWLFTILHNQHVNDVRRAVRQGVTVDLDDVASHLVAVADPTASRRLHELDRALGHLHLDQRQVILLVGLEGLSYEEVASILKIPVGTVRSRLSRGRDALRQRMGMDKETEAGAAAAKHAQAA
jgi:RNA polymerase sigma-70 factor (ECF subfamily)